MEAVRVEAQRRSDLEAMITSRIEQAFGAGDEPEADEAERIEGIR